MVVGMFKWGTKKGIGRKNKDIHYYESFIYYNVEYFLYDYVYLHSSTDVDAYIGKIVKIFETPDHERKIKVVWLFRPAEIRNFLWDYEPRWNELFLACGEGKGLSNINPVESIIGKCNLVCGAHDMRNPQASEEQLRMADFIFYRCFDVGECRIHEKFADHISGIEVKYFFNKWKDQKDTTPAEVNGHRAIRKFNSNSQFVQVAESKKRVASLGVQKHISDDRAMLRPKNPIDTTETGTTKISSSEANGKAKKLTSCWDSTFQMDRMPCLLKRESYFWMGRQPWFLRKLVLMLLMGLILSARLIQRPILRRENGSIKSQYLERLKRAEEAGTLVLLENLDPSLTSSEVEDLVRHAFNQIVEAKMIQKSTFSSPYYGKALVMFESKVAAVSAIKELQGRCLIMEDGRPIVGRKCSLNNRGEVVNFRGHLSIHQLRQRQSEEMRKAVSTSHYSQCNTLEYEMAVEWGILQEQSEIWWNNFFLGQAEGIEDVKRKRKTN